MGTAAFDPDPDQARVLDHRAGSLLVRGAAGTGKTAVLAERFATLIEDGADPERVALVVRTRRARQSIRSALLSRLGRSLPGLRVTTVHGLAYHVVGRRFELLGYDRPPEILTAGDQFARVRDMLVDEDPERWPHHAGMLGLRGFADEVRQFLLRAQEALLEPQDVLARAEARGLTGWAELAAFHARYLDDLAKGGLVDFGGLLLQAGRAASEDQPLFDHLLVDDYQDATLAAERLLIGLRPTALVVAGDPGSHVFSFQGTTDVPIQRFERILPAAQVIDLSTAHRSTAGAAPAGAWKAAHTSEEHAAIARELRRVHVEEGVPWNQMAVVVRRHGAHLGGLLRALDDADIPRVTPDRALSLLAEPASFPYILALRWLARPQERDGLVEALLTSDLAGLSPAAARGLVRAAVADGGHPADALGRDDGLTADEAKAVEALWDALAAAQKVADRSALDAFANLWRALPTSRRLVDAAGAGTGGSRRDLDAVVALSDAIARASDRTELPTAAFLDLLSSGDEGPGLGSAPADGDGVRVVTAHGVAGDEFDTVVVAEVVEGSFPSLSRPEPMFDLEALDRTISQSERNRLRLEDERRLFGVVLSRARRRVLITASDAHGDEANLTVRSRFVAERGVTWEASPAAPFADPLTVAEAHATWRHVLADPQAAAPQRLAALSGMVALGSDPATWWFQRDWSGDDQPLHEHLRVSHSRLHNLENCDLQYVLGQEIGLDTAAGYHAWVGSLVHTLIEDCENGKVERSEAALVAEAEARWRTGRFPSLAVSEAFRRLVTQVALPAWFREYGVAPALAKELKFEFEFDGATVTGVIDRIGSVAGGGTQITDYKTGKSRNAEPAAENLQLGMYYLAVQQAEDLAEYRPVRGVELAFLRDRERDGTIARTTRAFTGDIGVEFEEAMLGRLTGLVERLRDLQTTENYRPNPGASCRFCDFKTLCPLFPQGRPMFPTLELGAPATATATAGPTADVVT